MNFFLTGSPADETGTYLRKRALREMYREKCESEGTERLYYRDT